MLAGLILILISLLTLAVSIAMGYLFVDNTILLVGLARDGLL